MGHTLGGTRPRRTAIVAVLVLVATLLPPLAAHAAAPPSAAGRYPVVPGLVREVYNWSLPRGPVVVNVLRFHKDDQRVTFRPELADGHVAGREAVHETIRRLGDSAVAGVNANFFFADPGPYGEPEGLFVRNGVLYSEPQTKGRGWRGAFGIFPDGHYEVGFPTFSGTFTQPDGYEVGIDGINRHPGWPPAGSSDDGDLTLFGPSFGNSTLTRRDTTELVFHGVTPSMTLDANLRIAGISTRGNVAIPDGGMVLAASGQLAYRYRTLRPGDLVRIQLRNDLNWDSVAQAVGAGPVLIRDGALTPRSSWFEEGFGEHHNDRAHPRTVVGFLANGEILLVTADGRQSRSVGLTTAETAELMLHLGARDAVMMDGGGSTTMSVDGGIVNRPCCDSPGYREVGSSLVLSSNVPTPDVARFGDYNKWATARAVAKEGWKDGTDTAILANGDTFPDALAGGPLAAERGSPLLLTGQNWIPWSTVTALQELGVRDITVLGGEAAVSENVVNDLRSKGYRVARLAGTERTHTAAVIAAQLGAPSGRVFLASASNWPDALSTTVPAHRADAPLLTTWSDRLSEHTAYALEALNAREVVVVGGPAAISEAVVTDLRDRGYEVSRIAGPDRYGTSAALVDWAAANTGLGVNRVALATGHDFPDALVGGPFGARTSTPILLTNPLDIDRSPATRTWLDTKPLTQAYLVGGRTDVVTWVAHQLQDEIRD